MAEALDMVIDRLETRKFFKTFKFQYHPRMAVAAATRLRSSAGIRPGPHFKFVESDCNISCGTGGKKLEQLETAVRGYHKWMMAVHQGERPVLENYCIIKMKAEWRFAYMAREEELQGLPNKAREFFIPGMQHNIHSYIMMEKRMIIERGNAINIGRRWFYGGAYEMALYLNYDLPRMNWNEGDFYKFDKHIVDWLLKIYIGTTTLYYDPASMNKQERSMYTFMMETLMYNITVKTTCHLGDFWRVMRGVMYSGGKETSHGDSWIVLLVFCLYLVHTMTVYPTMRAAIMKAIERKLIAIVVYGDDHIWSSPQVLPMLSEHTFADFVKDFVGMKIRDIIIHKRFLSEVDWDTGELRKIGPKFLKRYFIAGDIVPVMPFKPYNESLIRLLIANQTPQDFVLSAIGQAWDTMGTNRVAYDAIEYVFRYNLDRTHCTPAQILAERESTMEGQAEMEKLRRKIHAAGKKGLKFPSYKKLRSLHKHDKEKVDHRKHPEEEVELVFEREVKGT